MGGGSLGRGFGGAPIPVDGRTGAGDGARGFGGAPIPVDGRTGAGDGARGFGAAPIPVDGRTGAGDGARRFAGDRTAGTTLGGGSRRASALGRNAGRGSAAATGSLRPRPSGFVVSVTVNFTWLRS